jgi:hypothetical protein
MLTAPVGALFALASAALIAPSSLGAEVILSPTQDNTIYSEGDFSNALHSGLIAGQTAGATNRRALMQFDAVSSIPAGSVITGATLSMRLSNSPLGASSNDFSLHKLTTAWGEATSNNDPQPGGIGDAATVGDATWASSLHPGTSWTTAGGDFVATASATSTVGTGPIFASWTSAQMVADVQDWLDNPATAFGWALIGDESTSRSARRFASVQNTGVTFRPELTVTFILSSTFCDGSDGSLASCPCANPGAADTGCDIQQGTGGVALVPLAQETSPLNRATVTGTGFPPASTPTSIVIRAAGLDTGSPVVFGDGLRCVGVPLVRLAATFANAGTSTHTFGHGAMAGTGTFYYQLWFRNTPIMFCDPAAAFNLSGGRTLDW